MSWLLTNFIAAILLPPLNLLLPALAGAMLWHRRPGISRVLVSASLGLLWLFSTPLFAEFLLHRLEHPAYPSAIEQSNAEAIVVLSAGIYADAPEYGGNTTGDASLVRIRYAATLHRQLGLPILITGGAPIGTRQTEAELMKATLENEFHVPVRWVESESRNTYESAHHSQEILRKQNIRKILLVTHAWHMPRALRAFENSGIEVTPAPTAFTTRSRLDILAFMPDATALYGSRVFFHELIGMLWYQLKS